MANQVLSKEEFQKKIAKGVKTISGAVKSTLGPKGRNVLIERGMGTHIVTKDGVTVARSIELQDEVENLAAQVVRAAASKTADVAGDGTTTATLLAEFMYNEGMRRIANGANPILVKRGMELATEACVGNLFAQAKKVSTSEEIKRVATVSANWDAEVGEFVSRAFDKVGKEGAISLEEGTQPMTMLKLTEGLEFNNGYISNYFCTNVERQTCEFEKPYLLIVERRVSTLNQILPILQLVLASKRPLLIIAEGFDGEPTANLIFNKMKGLAVCAVNAPGYGNNKSEMLQDIAIMTGGKIVSEEMGLTVEKTTLADLGSADKIVISKNSTTVIRGHGNKEAIETRIAALRNKVGPDQSQYENEKLKERATKLAGGIAIISVGAPTEIEMKEKKDRIEDALCATRAAIEEGIVAGGGVALLRTASALAKVKTRNAEEKIGVEIVKKALEAPLLTLCENAGLDSASIVDRVKRGKLGFNVATEKFEDLIKSGVIDPVKVTRSALQNATSVAGILLTTETVISTIKEKQPAVDPMNQPMPQPFGM